ncbi:type II toxin-antitoxin system PemK/MazF family toxin [Cellulomonas sp. JH27-2]|nr:type II toxin-antitoxin system PemK/MazF family toxin [Cellulomonas sp. JH27-2]MBD8059890.1 type II toxin-antitoxin system PemK/MazF family toxin [Cellulomonas sp. JH27-2]
MVISRGDVFWLDLGEPDGSRPALRRPVVVIQADAYNASRLATTVVAVMTSNTALAAMPGNVVVPSGAAGLPKDSVINVTALVTVNKVELVERAGALPAPLAHELTRGLTLVLGP